MTHGSESLIGEMLAEVRASFIDSLYGRIMTLENIAERARKSSGSVAETDQISAICHKIAGVAPTLGFADVGQQARHLEKVITNLLKSDDPEQTWSQVEDDIEAFLDALEALLDTEE
jgi:HPt (histidine-containing phosphotransfer) domain-containing protein